MATTVVEHLAHEGRFEDLIATAETILTHHPREGLTLVHLGSACGHLMDAEFTYKYPSPFLIPPQLRSRYISLAHGNRAAFEAAEALGWEPVE